MRVHTQVPLVVVAVALLAPLCVHAAGDDCNNFNNEFDKCISAGCGMCYTFDERTQSDLAMCVSGGPDGPDPDLYSSPFCCNDYVYGKNEQTDRWAKCGQDQSDRCPHCDELIKSECSTGCKTAVQCIVDARKGDGCDDLCQQKCIADIDDDSKIQALRIGSCYDQCEHSQHCGQYGQDLDKCEAEDGCTVNSGCGPNADVCPSDLSMRECAVRDGCKYSDDHCHPYDHYCYNIRSRDECLADKDTCQYNSWCAPDRSRCEDECQDSLLACKADADCIIGMQCIGEHFENGGCDGDCFAQCIGKLSTLKARHLLYSLGQCYLECEQSEYCRPFDQAKCTDESACGYSTRCYPSKDPCYQLPETECNADDRCFWRSQDGECSIDPNTNQCLKITDELSCGRASDCNWVEQCNWFQHDDSSRCEEDVCKDEIALCSTSTCQNAFDCVYNAFNTQGNCDTTCIDDCKKKADPAHHSDFEAVLKCQFECHEICIPGDSPSIVDVSAPNCIRAGSTVEIEVTNVMEWDIRGMDFLVALCSFYDNDGSCDQIGCNVPAGFDSSRGVALCEVPDTLDASSTSQLRISVAVVPVMSEDRPISAACSTLPGDISNADGSMIATVDVCPTDDCTQFDNDKSGCLASSACGYCSFEDENGHHELCLSGGPDGVDPDIYPDQCCDAYDHREGATDKFKRCDDQGGDGPDCGPEFEAKQKACEAIDSCKAAMECIGDAIDEKQFCNQNCWFTCQSKATTAEALAALRDVFRYGFGCIDRGVCEMASDATRCSQLDFCSFTSMCGPLSDDCYEHKTQTACEADRSGICVWEAASAGGGECYGDYSKSPCSSIDIDACNGDCKVHESCEPTRNPEGYCEEDVCKDLLGSCMGTSCEDGFNCVYEAHSDGNQCGPDCYDACGDKVDAGDQSTFLALLDCELNCHGLCSESTRPVLTAVEPQTCLKPGQQEIQISVTTADPSAEWTLDGREYLSGMCSFYDDRGSCTSLGCGLPGLYDASSGTVTCNVPSSLANSGLSSFYVSVTVAPANNENPVSPFCDSFVGGKPADATRGELVKLTVCEQDACNQRDASACTKDDACGLCVWYDHDGTKHELCLSGSPDAPDKDLYPHQCCHDYFHVSATDGADSFPMCDDNSLCDALQSIPDFDRCEEDERCFVDYGCVPSENWCEGFGRSECEASDMCRYDAGNQYCYMVQNPCDANDDADSCSKDRSGKCQWQKQCLSRENDGSASDRCDYFAQQELKECENDISCRTAMSCVEKYTSSLASGGESSPFDCDQDCIEECSMQVDGASLVRFISLYHKYFSCFSRERCRDLDADQCSEDSNCAVIGMCVPSEDNCHTYSSEDKCVADTTNACAWDEDHCHVDYNKHPCASNQAVDCSGDCEFRQECRYPGDGDKCEEEVCRDEVLACKRNSCNDGFECLVNAHSDDNICEAACFDKCTALVEKEDEEAFDALVECELTCHGECSPSSKPVISADGTPQCLRDQDFYKVPLEENEWDLKYGNFFVATCAFWIADKGCEWHGCQSAAYFDGSTVACKVPDDLTSYVQPGDTVHITVQLAPIFSLNYNSPFCFSYESTDVSSWAEGESLSVSICDEKPDYIPCTADAVPRVTSLASDCDVGDTISVNVDMQDYGMYAAATCAFWRQEEDDSWSCEWHGCYSMAQVVGGQVVCQVPDDLPDGEIKVTVQVYDRRAGRARQLNVCFSHEGQSPDQWEDGDYDTFTRDCSPICCSPDTVPSISAATITCDDDGEASVVTLTTDMQDYGVYGGATCAFWLEQDDDTWSCQWHGCYGLATITSSNSVECQVPEGGLPHGQDVKVTVQVYDRRSGRGRQLNVCFSHEGQTSDQWEDGDFATIANECDVGGCSPDTVPSITDISPSCGETDVIVLDVDMASYDHPDATCAFWRQQDDDTWSCEWHGCYGLASVVGGKVVCQVPEDMPTNEEVRITVQVYDQGMSAQERQLNVCFSHEGQTAPSWSDGDYAVFVGECPPIYCTEETVPRINGISPSCGHPSSVTLDVTIGDFGPNVQATCAFWIAEGEEEPSCTFHGCYAIGHVVSSSSITCEVPDNIPPDTEVFVTVQVFDPAAGRLRQLNYCFSHEGQSHSQWEDGDFGVLQSTCPPQPCAEDTVPRIKDIDVDCDAQTVTMSVDMADYEDPRATCAFWVPDSLLGRLSCNEHGGCYVSGRVVDGTVVCNIPDTIPHNAEVHVTVQVWDTDATDSRQSVFCFSHEGQTDSQWEDEDYAVFTNLCDAPPCTEETIPRIFDAEVEDCDDSETVRLSVSIADYGTHARGFCGFWLQDAATGDWSCEWHGCYSPATIVSADTVLCQIPDSVPEGTVVRITLQVYHEDNDNFRRVECFSHEGQSAASWSEHDFGEITFGCGFDPCTPETVPRVLGVEPGCGNDGDSIRLSVSMADYGVMTRATCGFWIVDDAGDWTCNPLGGCYVPATVSSHGHVDCSIPDGLEDLPAGTEVRITVQVYHAEAGRERQSVYCFSHEGQTFNWVSGDYGVYTSTCPVPECTEATQPRIEAIEPGCQAGEAITVRGEFFNYGEDAYVTCAFWQFDRASSQWTCNWMGCYGAGTYRDDGSIECEVPFNMPEGARTRVTVQVAHADANRRSVWCFSHRDNPQTTAWARGDFGLYNDICETQLCSKNTVPRVLDVKHDCDEPGVLVEYEGANYGADARATCGFWLETSDDDWKCLEGPSATFEDGRADCYVPASVSGDYIKCKLPEHLPSNTPVRVTVQLYDEDAAQYRQSSTCFSHELQSAGSWSPLDFGEFTIDCGPLPCSQDTVPRVMELGPRCGIHDAITVELAENPYEEHADATCGFWMQDDSGEWDCEELGCYVPAEVSGTTVTCKVPVDELPADATIRVTVQVFDSRSEYSDRTLNFCLSHEGKSASSWAKRDFGVFETRCPPEPCSDDTVPRILAVKPSCEAVGTVRLSVQMADYKKPMATCGFWVMHQGDWSCAAIDCYSPAVVIERGVVDCRIPEDLSDDYESVRITVQIYDQGTPLPQINRCFSHELQSAASWSRNDYGVYLPVCPPVPCLPSTVPQIADMHPKCGNPEEIILKVTMADYGDKGKATCGFWAYNDDSEQWDCTLISCYSPAVIESHGRVRCEVPLNFPDDTEVRTTVQVYHENANGRLNYCFSHEGRSSISWSRFDYAQKQAFCDCPDGTPAKPCPNTCQFRYCPAHPDAECSTDRCDNCRVYWTRELDNDETETLSEQDCRPRDRCRNKCAKPYQVCARNAECRASLAKLDTILNSGETCDIACMKALAPSNTVAARHFGNVVSCLAKCFEQSGQTGYEDVCALPKQPGPCRATIDRWFFNKETMQCEEFVYGGCEGNANNFESKEACESSCVVGACCTVERNPSGPNYGYGRDGYDAYGYNRNGYARDGETRRGNSDYLEYYLNRDAYGKNGYDRRGYNADFEDRAGYDIRGRGKDGYTRDGRQFTYADDQQYDRDGYDRSGLNEYGLDRNQFNYLGLYAGGSYRCRQLSRDQCEAQSEKRGVTVLSFAQGRSCDDLQCGRRPEPRTCLFNGETFKFGQTFKYACQECTCHQDGTVSCKCPATPHVRKEIRDMSEDEMDAFVDAVRKLHETGGWTRFAALHLSAVPSAHGNEAFWPWHREFLYQFEMALREVSGDCDITVPYWDWTIDALHPERSPVWLLVGGNGDPENNYCVTDGPFAGFEPCIVRNWNNQYPIPSFPDIARILSGESYRAVVSAIEARHGDVHMYIGGIMTSFASPYDPIFFLHHAFVDKLWYDWQTTFGNGYSYNEDLIHETMDPFPKTPAHVMSTQKQLCYVYAQPGSRPPCDEDLFVGAGFYDQQNRDYTAFVEGYNRDGIDGDGYDRDGYDRYLKDSNGDIDPTRQFDADGYDQNGYDRDGFDRNGFDSYGYDADMRDAKGCDAGSNGPFYMQRVYQLQQQVYKLAMAGELEYTRTCRPLRVVPSWWMKLFWVKKGGDYEDAILSYERDIKKAYDSYDGRYDEGREYSGDSTDDFCFELETDPEPSPLPCARGVLPKKCADTCADAFCTNNREATCRVNPCTCKPEFFDDSGEPVQCYDVPTCPAEETVSCLVNPCRTHECPANPDAVCVPSYCGGCNAYFFDPTNGFSVKCEEDPEPEPCICTTEYEPVCGTDQKTYSNLCVLKCAGAELDYAGKCVSCEKRCPPAEDPEAEQVCGVDGSTYATACLAQCKQVDIRHTGPCPKLPKTCDDVNDFVGSVEERQEFCLSTRTTCLAESDIDADLNTCIWDPKRERCGCRPTDEVCDANFNVCKRCCSSDMEQCRLDGNDRRECAGRYSKCMSQCKSSFSPDMKGKGKITFTFNINLDNLSPEDVEYILASSANTPGLHPYNMSTTDVMFSTARRRDAGDALLTVEVVVPEDDADDVANNIGEAFEDGSVAENAANMPGGDVDFGSIALSGSPSVSTTTTTQPITTTQSTTTDDREYVYIVPVGTLPEGATMTAAQKDDLLDEFISQLTISLNKDDMEVYLSDSSLTIHVTFQYKPTQAEIDALADITVSVSYKDASGASASTSLTTGDPEKAGSGGGSDDIGVIVGAAVAGVVALVIIIVVIVLVARKRGDKRSLGDFERPSTFELKNPAYDSNVEAAQAGSTGGQATAGVGGAAYPYENALPPGGTEPHTYDVPDPNRGYIDTQA